MNIFQKHISHYVLHVLLIIIITKICPLNNSNNITNAIFNSTKSVNIIPYHEHSKNIETTSLTDVAFEDDDETPDYEFTIHFHQLTINAVRVFLFSSRLSAFYTHHVPKVYLTLFTPPPEV